jgi:preprotein translocase subunit SecE
MVDWPNRRELISYTVVVLATLAVLTTFVFGLDFVFSRAILKLLG